MSKKYIIGVDGGTQSSKVTIFDLEGRVVCEGKQSLKPMNLPMPGHVEHPDDDLWDSIVAACRQAISSFPGNVNDILGLGLCTIRFCRVLLKEDGSLAHPVLSWMDERVSRPYEHKEESVRYVTSSSGYITHRLTGRFVDTAASYQGQWPIDTDGWEWSGDAAVLKHYNLPREKLFELQMPGTILGYVTQQASQELGIPFHLPVIATANDKAVEALGAGLLDEKTGLVSLGTYIASMLHGSRNLTDKKNLWTNFAAIPGRYLYESHGIRRGMWTVSWFAQLLGDDITLKANEIGVSPEGYLEREAVGVPPGCNGLMTVLDWLAPSEEPFKRGTMIGFNAYHTRAHIYRSILEAAALTMKNRADAMCAELGITLERIILSGGGSKSDLMTEIFADVFGIPVIRNHVGDSAGLGSAICVAVSLGIYDSYESAVRNMVKVKDIRSPNEENYEFYKQMNEEVYQLVPSYTDPLYRKSYDVFG